jgi:hypothetical protein
MGIGGTGETSAGGTFGYLITRQFSAGVLTSTIVDDQGALLRMSSGTHTTSGTTLTWSVDCPEADTATFEYSATSARIILQQDEGAGPICVSSHAAR